MEEELEIPKHRRKRKKKPVIVECRYVGEIRKEFPKSFFNTKWHTHMKYENLNELVISFLADCEITLIRRFDAERSGKKYIAGIDNLGSYEVWEDGIRYHVNGIGDSEAEAIEDFAEFISGKNIKRMYDGKIFTVPRFTNWAKER